MPQTSKSPEKVDRQVSRAAKKAYERTPLAWLLEQIEKDKAKSRRRYFAFGGVPKRDEEYLKRLEGDSGFAEGSEERRILHDLIGGIQEESLKKGLGYSGTWRPSDQVGYTFRGKNYGREGKYQISYNYSDLVNPYRWGRLVEDNVRSVYYQILYDKLEAKLYQDLRDAGKSLRMQAEDLQILSNKLRGRSEGLENRLKLEASGLVGKELPEAGEAREAVLKECVEKISERIEKGREQARRLQQQRGKLQRWRGQKISLEEDLAYLGREEEELLGKEKGILERKPALQKEKEEKEAISLKIAEERKKTIEALKEKKRLQDELRRSLEEPGGLRDRRRAAKRELDSLLRERDQLNDIKMRGDALSPDELSRLKSLNQDLLGSRSKAYEDIRREAGRAGSELGKIKGEIKGLKGKLRSSSQSASKIHPDIAVIEAELDKISELSDGYKNSLIRTRKKIGDLRSKRRAVDYNLRNMERRRKRLARDLVEERKRRREISENEERRLRINEVRRPIDDKISKMIPRFREWFAPRSPGDTLFNGRDRSGNVIRTRGRLWQLQDFVHRPFGYMFRSFVWKGDPLPGGRSIGQILRDKGWIKLPDKVNGIQDLIFPKGTLRGNLYQYYTKGFLNREGREAGLRAYRSITKGVSEGTKNLGESFRKIFKPSPGKPKAVFTSEAKWYPKGLKQVGPNYLDKFANSLRSGFSKVADKFKDLSSGLKEGLRPLLQGLKPILEQMVKMLGQLLKQLLDVVLKLFTRLASALFHGSLATGGVGLGAGGAGTAGAAGAGGAAGTGGLAAETVAETGAEIAAAPETAGTSLIIPVVKILLVVIVLIIVLIVIAVVAMMTGLKDFGEGGAAAARLTLSKNVDVLDVYGGSTGSNRIETLDNQAHGVRYRITLTNSGDEEATNISLYDDRCGQAFTPSAVPGNISLEVGTCDIEVIADTDRLLINTVSGTAMLEGSTVNLTATGILIIGNPPDVPPSGWPISEGCITQGPGGAFSHQSSGTVYGNALDIAPSSDAGYDIAATHDGIAGVYYSTVASGDGPYPGFGFYVVLTSTGGTFSSVYAHMESINVTHGQAVARGQLIGRVDSTVGPGGSSTGDHIHYALSGLSMDAPYIPVNVPTCSGSAPDPSCGSVLDLNAGQNCFKP